ncbi:MAG: nucleoid-structuring protein H-NS [Candidatus Nitrohelix vancouverensis]|uniref:Nucleoid-structuring protein H-NS n=1 Tax=Candidatus Nitrohelix vancouverensis TaxID=2705534 RepID=A0A7T0C3K9_9BACT|nr:MAG: nucleoid-structuring protein H-NS [Candidatus Nitrohelix vancouverensis]
MFRKEIKVLDCTIRDGGLMNNHQFSDEFVSRVFQVVNAAGVDYIELGYKADESQFSRNEFGPMKFCSEKDIETVVGKSEKKSKISVMVDIGRVNPNDIPLKSESLVDMMRIASYTKDIDKAIDLVNSIKNKGYETTINIMAVSHARENELEEALEQIENESQVDVVYLVDSFGALYSEQITYLAKKYKRILKTRELGIHAHNNQQLAFANTIESIINNINYLDGTILGIGRAAGNCPLELLLGFLKNPKYDLRPILEVLETDFVKLSKEIEWGYTIPYMLTGIMDLHPRSGMKLRRSENKDAYLDFYEQLINEASV